MAEKSPATRDDRTIARREPEQWRRRQSGIVDRFANEMDRLLADFGFGAGRISPFGQRGFTSPARGAADWPAWAPEVEVFQGNNELVVRADLPGLKKEDVTVNVTDDEITISGERRHEHEEERAGLYQSERMYGSFCRTMPLPAGAIGDQAKASFKDGVLEIRMPAPPEQVTQGRRLEISDATEQKP
ncbi:MAG TPA: Hsp20/alpha crystallin family protein [Vicinamibacterales bacterium]|nr:Hsp20/alpha crystallin family protein [Vicinamibacterales bacterium]